MIWSTLFKICWLFKLFCLLQGYMRYIIGVFLHPWKTPALIGKRNSTTRILTWEIKKRKKIVKLTRVKWLCQDFFFFRLELFHNIKNQVVDLIFHRIVTFLTYLTYLLFALLWLVLSAKITWFSAKIFKGHFSIFDLTAVSV